METLYSTLLLGIIAGINAALKAKWLTNNSEHSADEFYNPLIIDRTQGKWINHFSNSLFRTFKSLHSSLYWSTGR